MPKQNPLRSRRPRLQAMLCVGCVFALTSASLPAQQPRTRPTLVTTALAPDTCPDVVPGQKLTLDWNPAFEHPGAVDGVILFRLSFGRRSDNGVVRKGNGVDLGGRGSAFSVTPAANGAYHFEFQLPAHMFPGEYRLYKAEGIAHATAGYTGPAMEMTNSPAGSMFCFKVPASAPSQIPPG